MRGTVYIYDANGAPVGKRVCEAPDAQNDAEFQVSAATQIKGTVPEPFALEFGPIAKPWGKL